MKLFCVECIVFVCSTCANFGTHQGHDVKDLKTAYATIKQSTNV